ncbi:unnamed protein product [Linum tenue]|uniref:Uncharacterized protein n=1 Tax=Linum tenue TaxID=586396 RepID=A0AAV0GQ85_9ROSI|nr:unnamed protein product [Linum tenue]
MKPYLAVFGLPESKKRSWLCSVFIAASLICGIYFLGFASVGKEYKEQKFTRWPVIGSMSGVKAAKCKNQRMPIGSEPLPSGIVAEASDLEMRPLWSASTKKEKKQKRPMSLLAIAVGIQQKEVVNRIVGKFPSSDFIVMLFHYDGVVEKWGDLSWSDRAIHISAVNQTKWWFAKRFLHPDIVAEYDYVFIWDEDIGVENFNPSRYLSVVKEQGLEISQPALDRSKSEVHFPITARNRKSTVHRLVLKLKLHVCLQGNQLVSSCSWVEIMAPVFSKAAWRCVWYMIQNDLIHAWGLDTQLGYCAQGDRAKNVGVVDSEYIVHLGLPTLGVFNKTEAQSETHKVDNRPEVRMQSHMEMLLFKKRWENAVVHDKCWFDPYQSPVNHTTKW